MFDAGAVIGRAILDKGKWDSSVSSIKKSTQEMKSSFKSFTSSVKENWLAMTATIGVAIVTVNRAWNMMELGAKAKQVEDSFNATARAAGIAGDELERSLIAASAYTTDLSDIASATSSLINQKLSPVQITTLMQVARMEARKTGQQVSEAYAAISNAISAGFTRSLSAAYGLNINASFAVENYARAMGLTKDQVERYYKAQAIANEIIAKTRSELTGLNAATLTQYERVQQLRAQWNQFVETVGSKIMEILTVLGAAVGVVIETVYQLFAAFEWGFNWLISKIPGLKQIFGELSDYWANKLAESQQKSSAYMKEMEASIKSLFGGMSSAAETGSGEFTEKVGSALSEFNSGIKEALEENIAQMNDWKATGKEIVNSMVGGMRSSLSNFFQGFLKGEIRSAKQLFVEWGNFVLKIISDVLAQLIAVKIATAIMGFMTPSAPGGGGSGSGGSGGGGGSGAPNLTTSLAVGTDYIPETGLYRIHKGEKVTPRYDSNKGENIELTIINQITSSAINAAIAEDPSTVINIIGTDDLRNGQVRQIRKIRGK
jgi:hypothetical protein